MFARLFSMFMAVLILALTAVGFLTYATMRNLQIDNRLEELKKEAQEIAYLAAQKTVTAANLLLGIENPTQAYLNWKAASVYEDFGAYILVLDASREEQVLASRAAMLQSPAWTSQTRTLFQQLMALSRAAQENWMKGAAET